jgi:DNA gyrase subunit A
MATNMPPHNLTEVIDGTLAYMDNNIEIDELINISKHRIFNWRYYLWL